MSALERRDLGRRGIDWVRSSLAEGRTVAAAVSGAVDLDAGTAVALVPRDTAEGRAAGLEAGGVTNLFAAIDPLDDLLAEAAGAGPATLVVEHAYALPTDGWVADRRPDDVAVAGEVVVHWLALPAAGTAGPPTAGSATAGRFLLRKGGGYPTNAFVVGRSPAELGLAPMAAVPDLPAAVAGHVEAIVVAAYDAESVVVWCPPPTA